MESPKFETAVPKRRYQVGGFRVVLLGDVQSRDSNHYQYILAFVPEGSQEPFLYITSEKNQGESAAEGSHRIRIVAPHDARVLGANDRWSDIELFAEDGLLMGRKLLDLMDEEPYRMM